MIHQLPGLLDKFAELNVALLKEKASEILESSSSATKHLEQMKDFADSIVTLKDGEIIGDEMNTKEM